MGKGKSRRFKKGKRIVKKPKQPNAPPKFVDIDTFYSHRVEASHEHIRLKRHVGDLRENVSQLIDINGSLVAIISKVSNIPEDQLKAMLTEIYESKRVIMSDGSIIGKVSTRKYNIGGGA